MIELKSVGKTIGNKVLYKNLTTEFKTGNSYALIGASGSGKSTLLNMIAGLDSPTSGAILIDGKALSKKNSQNFFRNSLGYMFQNFALIDNKTIKENLMLALAYKKISRNEKSKRINNILNRLNIMIDTTVKVYTLSGGEQQRVALARLILKEPTIILADEPTGSLDQENGDQIIDSLMSLKNESTIIIIATHDLKLAKKCDAILNMTAES